MSGDGRNGAITASPSPGLRASTRLRISGNGSDPCARSLRTSRRLNWVGMATDGESDFRVLQPPAGEEKKCRAPTSSKDREPDARVVEPPRGERSFICGFRRDLLHR